MRAADAVRLAALAAIWGAAFIFIRVAAPVLGPLWTTEVRLLIGAAALFLWFSFTGVELKWRQHFRFYALIGVVGTADPVHAVLLRGPGARRLDHGHPQYDRADV